MENNKLKCLVIEDNPGDVRLLEIMLTEERPGSYEIIPFNRLTKGFEYLESNTADIILTDLSLPDSHGLETFTRIRSKAPRLPIIVLSSQSDLKLANDAMLNGAQDYLVKGQINGNLVARSISYAMARKKIEEDLRSANELNLALIDTIPFWLDVIDKDGTILFANDKLQKALKGDPKGRKCWEVLRQDQNMCQNCTIGSTLKPGKSVTIENSGFIEERTLQTSVAGFMYQGRFALLEIHQDITDRIKAENMKNDFLRMVSHELRTPLAIIKEALSLTIGRILGELSLDQENVLRSAMNNTDRLTRLVNDLLDSARIEAGKMELRLSDTDLLSLIRSVIAGFRQLAMNKKLELKDNISENNIIASVDADRITQVITNLLGNAIKFTPAGSIEVKFRTTDYHYEFCIEDTGIGIAPEDLPRLFNKFEQFNRGYTPSEKGTGLGLSISKGIVEKHGGRIWAESKLGKGTSMYFTIALK